MNDKMESSEGRGHVGATKQRLSGTPQTDPAHTYDHYGLRTIHWDEIDKRKFYFWSPALFMGVHSLLYPANLVKIRLQVGGTS